MHTPSTDEVRSAWVVAFNAPYMTEARESFDRWLSAEEARIRADERQRIAEAIKAVGDCETLTEQEPTDAQVERLCEVMHNAYEDAAVKEGWSTQEASRKPWSDVPEANKRTMRIAVRAVLLAAKEASE